MTADPTSVSALYPGRVMHKRMMPFVHAFTYRVFSVYVDLAELPQLHRKLRLFSHNRWNLFSFNDRDHGPRDGSPLRPWIERHLQAAGIDLAGGSVRVLCFPRVLGYVFNPLSIWFCYHADGQLRAILYEVNNTFGERHGYLMPVTAERRPHDPILQSCTKDFYVSPFISMAARYDFRLAEPDERLGVSIRQWVQDGTILFARQSGRRRRLTDRSLLRMLATYPLMTLKIMGAIHWEALWLSLKGARLVSRPAPPPLEVTVIEPNRLAAAQ